MANVKEQTGNLAAMALDKLTAIECVARFYNATQRYDCERTHWEEIEELIDEQMIYLTGNLRDPNPMAKERFLEIFREIHDVHASDGRGSFYGLCNPVTRIEGDLAFVTHHILVNHWLSAANEESTWFYGVVDAELSRRSDRWKIRKLDVATMVRVEGHFPPIDGFYRPN